MCAHTSSVIRTHHPRPEIEKYALITFYRSVQMCTHTSSAIRVLHPSSFIRFESLTARFLTCADRSGWQIIPTRIIILIEFSHQITELVCKNLHLYNLCLLQYNGAKITTNAWVSGALELDIDVLYQCYTYLLLCFIVLNIDIRNGFKLINIY